MFEKTGISLVISLNVPNVNDNRLEDYEDLRNNGVDMLFRIKQD